MHFEKSINFWCSDRVCLGVWLASPSAKAAGPLVACEEINQLQYTEVGFPIVDSTILTNTIDTVKLSAL
jgi:hypothetical protein